MKVLLGVTGSVAATLTPKLYKALIEAGHEVGVVATKRSLEFFDREELTVPKGFSLVTPTGELLKLDKPYLDEDEWTERYKPGQEILHIELRKWADVLLIAPLTANTLGKMAHGICDNLLTSIYRAWDMSRPVVIAPAMNTFMWQHPATQEALVKLSGWHDYGQTKTGEIHIIQPVEKKLACGDVGIGAMAPIIEIVHGVRFVYQRWLARCQGLPLEMASTLTITPEDDQRLWPGPWPRSDDES